MRRNARRGSNGFTIVELLIVIVVIAILVAIAIVAYTGVQGRAVESGLKSDLRNGSKELGVLNATDGIYPPDDSALKASDGNAFIYTKNDDNTYCLTGYSNKYGTHVFHVENGDEILPGACAGHTVPGGDGGSGGSSGGSGGFIACTMSSQEQVLASKIEAYTQAVVNDARAKGNSILDYDTSVGIVSENQADNAMQPTQKANVSALSPQWTPVWHLFTGYPAAAEIMTDSSGYYYAVQASQNTGGMITTSDIALGLLRNDDNTETAQTAIKKDGTILVPPIALSVEEPVSDLTALSPCQLAQAYGIVVWEVTQAYVEQHGTSATAGSDITGPFTDSFDIIGPVGGPWVFRFKSDVAEAYPDFGAIRWTAEAAGSDNAKLTSLGIEE